MTETPQPRIPEGWVHLAPAETFSAMAGPIWFRPYSETEPGCGFLSEPRHANYGGVIHGGALLTLADMALWDICRRVVGRFRGVTVTMNAEFLAPGPIGKFIMATGEATKIGRSLMFARGQITCNGEMLLVFSGALKKVSPE
jgi:uncharacterized protein (TIGR00369 family)